MTIFECVDSFIQSNIITTLRLGVYTCGRGKTSKVFSNCLCSFDTETTSIRTNDVARAYVYIFQFGLLCDGKQIVILDRHIDNIKRLVDYVQDYIKEHTKLKNRHKTDRLQIVIGVHNFGFDFSFIHKYFEWSDVFCKQSRQPLTAKYENTYWVDTYIMSGRSLDKTAKDFCTSQKLKGDLNYSLIRHYDTPLTEKEKGYCVNDAIIVCEFLQHTMDEYVIKQGFFPITATSIVRQQIKKEFKAKYQSNAKSMRNFITENLFPKTMLEYDYIMKWLFRGGYTHANAMYVDEVLENVFSMDFTSSYPSWLLCDKYPVSGFHDTTIELAIGSGLSWYALIEFTNIKSTTNHSIESSSKCINLENAVIDNGRVVQAHKMTVMLTNLDYEIYKLFYVSEEMDVLMCRVSYCDDFLPTYITTPLANAYETKARLKTQGKPYAVEKSFVNSIYGCMVTTIPSKEISYKNGLWCDPEPKTDTDRMKDVAKQILSPFWGIWCTAYARYYLLRNVYKMHTDTIYNDTDSLKGLNLEKHQHIFYEHNKWQENRVKEMCERLHLDFSLMYDIGAFDYEGTYTYFKTLGAKRYCTIKDDKMSTTVAGLPKGAFEKYLENVSRETLQEKMNKYFTNQLSIKDCKNAHAYLDRRVEEYLTDYTGKTRHVESLDGCCIYPIDFTMKVNGNWLEWINHILKKLERNDYIK